MSEESQKPEQSGQNDGAELSVLELEQVAGGTTLSTSKSGIKSAAGPGVIDGGTQTVA